MIYPVRMNQIKLAYWHLKKKETSAEEVLSFETVFRTLPRRSWMSPPHPYGLLLHRNPVRMPTSQEKLFVVCRARMAHLPDTTLLNFVEADTDGSVTRHHAAATVYAFALQMPARPNYCTTVVRAEAWRLNSFLYWRWSFI